VTDPLIIDNTITGKKIFKCFPLEEEIFLSKGIMITETDINGIITYANRKFREITGFSYKELIGSPHSIVRHPDMPQGLFRGMWKTIVLKKTWCGYIKNMRKDGKFYWVLTYIQPKFDENNIIIGYVSGTKKPNYNALKEMEEKYIELYGDRYINHKFFMGGELICGDEIASRS
jgi:PAS domain S-box-containing protein